MNKALLLKPAPCHVELVWRTEVWAKQGGGLLLSTQWDVHHVDRGRQGLLRSI